MHPRTRKNLEEQGLLEELTSIEHLKVLPPVGYFDFLSLMRRCELILSDSGGLQEEVTAPSLGKFIIVLRTSTERPEAVEAGYAKVMGFEVDAILDEMQCRIGKSRPSDEYPYGTGDAGPRTVDIIEEYLSRS
jgi:UDP-N-acetylglucosamine 2-epimerase (non-hydrolysing)